MHNYSGSVSPSAVGTKTPLAHMVVSPIATSTSGVLPSTHWHRYQTCARATCTVFLVVVVVVVVVLDVYVYVAMVVVAMGWW